MERLSLRKEDGTGTCIQNCTCEANCGFIWDVFTKLADYEDAEEQGLLLRLPCKVGDTVWYEDKNSTWLIGVHPYQITNVMISQNKKGEWTKKYRAMRIYNGKTVDWQINFSFDDIGTIVFLTKEEAEQKLASMRGGE